MSFKDNLTRGLYLIGSKIQEKSPEILIAAGVGGLIFASVTACKKTLELPEIIDKHKAILNEVTENMSEDGQTVETSEGQKKVPEVVAQVQAHYALDVIKLYALPVGIGMLSVACIIGSHYIMTKRHARAMGAYFAVSEAFNAYRDRVKNRFGDDVEREIRYNIKKEEVTEEVIDDKGKKKLKKNVVNVVNPEDVMDDFSALFSSWTSTEWNTNMDYNRMKITQVQNFGNDRLQTKGKYFINEILEGLGMDGRESGQYVGWLYSDKVQHEGDNKIIINYEEVIAKNPKTGLNEPAFILEFNADGNILKKAFADYNGLNKYRGVKSDI